VIDANRFFIKIHGGKAEKKIDYEHSSAIGLIKFVDLPEFQVNTPKR